MVPALIYLLPAGPIQRSDASSQRCLESDRGSLESGDQAAQSRVTMGCSRVVQPRAGEPANATGSPGSGMVGVRQAVAAVMASATCRHSAGFHPSAIASTVPSTRMNAKAGMVEISSAFTTERSASAKVRNWSAIGPRNRRVSSSSAVRSKLTRAWHPRSSSSNRTADLRIHELSLVYGSSTTVAMWNVVSHSDNGRASPPTGCKLRSSASFTATRCDRSDFGVWPPNMANELVARSDALVGRSVL